MPRNIKPEILAPAGDPDCFLAALAAGADGIYLGLKNFSARMEARNFSLSELGRLVELAHKNDCRVYVAMNNMLRQPELDHALRLTRRLATEVDPDGLIIQDLAMPDIARQAGFKGILAFSTLANISDPVGLAQAARAGAARVIVPRELSIDEIREMSASCPAGLELECFVQGALCYCVSGRCYWSSYMGGKSGLRGRCVQPCRRLYSRQQKGGGHKKAAPSNGERLFACQDLELLPLMRELLSVPHIASWKIEGRKKGPHYVYHTVSAYRLLRDCAEDPNMRKKAHELLAIALGRPGTQARFSPGKKLQPMAPRGQTSSGMLAGRIAIQRDGVCALKTCLPLAPKDYLRIGVEDEKWHSTFAVSKRTEAGELLPLKLPRQRLPKDGVPVYLIDRREPEFQKLLQEWRQKLENIPPVEVKDVSGSLMLPAPIPGGKRADMLVRVAPFMGKWKHSALQCLWLTKRSAAISRTLYERTFFWLPPVIWPDNEDLYQKLINGLWQGGARRFVCNAPWQRGFFPEKLPEGSELVAGPFCNIANSLAIAKLRDLDFVAAFASPELTGKELLRLPALSPLPLGLVIGGFWPVGMSRFGLAGLEAGEMFFSPRGEGFWSRDLAGMSWIYPAWPLDLADRRQELEKSGYSFFAILDDKPGKDVTLQKRPGLFNWDGALL